MNNIKLVVLGTGSVGKSSITIRFVHKEFVDKYDPTIEDLYRTPIEYNGQIWCLEIMDTSGTEILRMRDLYIRNGLGFLLVYGINSMGSFLELQQIKEQIVRVKEMKASDMPILVIGNKADLESDRQVSSDEAQQLCAKWGVEFMEASAKTGMNIDSVFESVVKQVQDKLLAKKPKKQSILKKTFTPPN
ncbi:hypothetical protein DFA_02753 [Cavenderia fasciculata]|uniref:small monomeric GTPase n=1 Tax=Cavenderia fasciculata TaxID=261658 RepID=F4PI23_CACFS|nr:uncharacterized protein DFA_02753 [Cavenderia fasciculata]EGG24510.1 hypothetical protein DFA_02753 [Cavenderia fasciculata]|eukprot:XP_004362361.1 hypothetical protein DFA_02753 [Cavenderia fasciculata]